jgi:hypothetical protein
MMPPANLNRIIVRAGAERSGVGTLAVALQGLRRHLSVAVGTLAVALQGVCQAHTASLIVERIPHDE